MLYRRAVELNYDNLTPKPKLTRYNKVYDYERIENYLVTRKEANISTLTNQIDTIDIENALLSLDRYLYRHIRNLEFSLKNKRNFNDECEQQFQCLQKLIDQWRRG